MKKAIATFSLMIAAIVCVLAIALFGVRNLKIAGVFDEGGIRLGLDLAGGSTIVYDAVGADPSSEEMSTAISMIRSRLDLLNYSEATVTLSGTRNIRVEIPGISDPEEAVQKLGASAVLEFVDADGNVVLDGADIKTAVASYGDTGKGYAEYFVSLELNADAVSKFAEATRLAAARASEGKNYIAISLDGSAISSPSVEHEINSDKCVITGNYDAAGAEYLAGIISAGNLPFALVDIQLSATGPILGEKSLESSLIAGAIGVVLVMFFMMIIYKLPGVISAIALLAYVGIIGVTLVITQANLSLPGIAGIVLSIGMAVDANVIIFERIKEELRDGKSLKAAVKSGFSRAFTAILDSNITTLIAALVLWVFGTGPIIGFATTLFMGILISMFTAIVVTRILLNQVTDIVRNKKAYGI